MGFPIDIEVNPSGATKGIGVVEAALAQLEQLATKAGRKMQDALTLRAQGQGTTGFQGLKDAIGKNSAAEIEHLIGGFNKAAVAGSQFRGAMVQAGQSSSFASKLFGGLNSELGAMAISFATLAGAKAVLSGIVHYSDEFTNMQNKLRQVTDGTEELNTVTDRLKGIANSTGQTLDSTAQIYARTTNAIKELGYGSATSLQFTEQLSKVIATSGANSIEAAQAMLQLSQGLGRGVLQGQDLKAVLEDVPKIGQVIAKGMGVTFGQLKQLGTDGKITSDAIIKAFKSMGDSIDDDFAKRVPTAGQAFSALQNDIEVFIGEVVGSLGPALGDLVADFEGMLEAIKPTAVEVAKLVVQFGAPILKDVGEYIRSTAEYLGNMAKELEHTAPLLAKFLEVAATAPPIITYLTKAQDELVNSTHNLNEEVERGIVAGKKKIAQLAFDDKVAAKFAEIEKERKDSEAADDKKLKDALKESKRRESQAKRDGVSASKAAEAADKKHRLELVKLLDTLFPVIGAQRDLAKVQAGLEELAQAGTITWDQEASALRRYTQAHAEALDPVKALSAALHQEASDAALDDVTRERVTRHRAAENELTKDGIDVLGESAQGYLREVDALVRSQQAHAKNQAILDRHKSLLESIQQPLKDYTQLTNDLYDLWKAGSISFETFVNQAEKAQAALGTVELPTDKFLTFNAAVVEGFNAVRDNALNVGQDISAAISGAFDQGLDAITTFLTTGKLQFKQFAVDTLQQIDKIILKLLLLQAIKGVAGGSKAASFAKLLGFAQGGSFKVGGSGGTDSQVVAFRATPREQVIVRTPGQQASGAGTGGGGGPIVVKNNIVNVDDPQHVYDTIESPRGERAILNVPRRNRSALKGL